MEVSIEPDERPTILRLGQRHVLMIGDAERQVDDKVDPAVLGVHLAHVDPHRPLAAASPGRQVDLLSGLHLAWRLSGYKPRVPAPSRGWRPKDRGPGPPGPPPATGPGRRACRTMSAAARCCRPARPSPDRLAP